MADLRQAEENGINTVLARADRHIMRTLNDTGMQAAQFSGLLRHRKILSTPTSTNTSRLLRVINRLLSIITAARPINCMQKDDSVHYAKVSNVSVTLIVLSDSARMIHRFSSIATLKDMNVDFYVCALYNHTRHRELYLPDDRSAAFAVIQAIPMPIITIKVLAAGRNEPREALQLALENIKPTDAMAVGMYTEFQPDQIRQNALTVAELIRKPEDEPNCRARSYGHSRNRRSLRCDGARGG